MVTILMNRAGKITCPLLICMVMFLLQSCSTINSTGYTLTIAHLNDTHSHLEAVPVNLTINGVTTTAYLGGFPRLQTLVDEMRANSPNFLLLHAGDAVQGTLYFTLFGGVVEFDFLNRLKVDAMTFGNHEFDRGPSAIPGFLARAKFPIVSSNIDFSGEPAIAGLVPRAIVDDVNGEQIGIIGLTTVTTPQSTLNVGNVKFLDAVTVARQQVAELEGRGINKIIALTHLGYEEDVKLAAAVNGIDIIVGGHSHTLLGDPARLGGIGLVPEQSYPTEITTPDGGKTLVVQAWQWGYVLGNLRVTFDSTGRVRDYVSGATIPVGDAFSRNGTSIASGSPVYREIVLALQQTGMARIVAEDEATVAALAPYAAQLKAFRTRPVATAAEDLLRTINSGPGPLGADSMLAAVPKAQVALFNYGGVRKDLLAGTISAGDVLEVMPFGNTLVAIDLTGDELKKALEEDIDFLLAKYGRHHLALPYVAGISLSVIPAADKGKRVVSLTIRGSDGTYRTIDPAASYRTVVNSFIANGGDGFSAIRNARGFRTDTGIIDSDAFRDYLKNLVTVHNPREHRITVITVPAASIVSPRWADNYAENLPQWLVTAGLP
jgi:5'-nucleotidase / UDP-sugar diphosphatase